MLKSFILLIGLAFLLVLPSGVRAADEPIIDSSPETSLETIDTTPGLVPEEFVHGRVSNILDEGEQVIFQQAMPYQQVEILLLSGINAGKTITIEHGKSYSIQREQKVARGDQLVLAVSGTGEEQTYYIADQYRIPILGWFALAFILVVLLVSGMRGAKALVGLIFTFGVLIWFIVPRIIDGQNPFVVSLVAAVLITGISLILAHGRNRRTYIAMAATFVTLLIAVILGSLSVTLAHMTGLASEEAYQLQFGLANLNFRGLLLAGMIIGVLGVLDDITTAQTTVVSELKDANTKLTRSELYRRGMAVGREHIASLVNTLVLAYAGVSLPLFLFFGLNQTRPVWFLINSEFISEELIRAFVGSMTLVLAVPITTAFAAWYFSRSTKPESTD